MGEDRLMQPRMLVVIVNRDKGDKMTELISRNDVPLHFQCHAYGTANSEILSVLGLGKTDKTVALSFLPDDKSQRIMEELKIAMKLTEPGRGIAFTIPLAAVTSFLERIIGDDGRIGDMLRRKRMGLRDKLADRHDRPIDRRDRAADRHDKHLEEILRRKMEREAGMVKNDASYRLIMAVINQGYSEELMDAARKAGAGGGTVIRARGVSGDSLKRMWGVTVQEEREIVLIIAPTEKSGDIMRAIAERYGFNTEAQGVMFALPVDSVEGLS